MKAAVEEERERVKVSGPVLCRSWLDIFFKEVQSCVVFKKYLVLIGHFVQWPNDIVLWRFLYVQELLREALEEERGRSENAIQQAVERAQEQVRTKMEDMAKV